MGINEIIASVIGSHFMAGAAGGLVRSFHVREAWAVSAMRTIAGGVSAQYLTPIALWAAPRVIEITQEDMINFSEPAGLAVAFLVGLLGIFLSTSVEKLISKKLKL